MINVPAKIQVVKTQTRYFICPPTQFLLLPQARVPMGRYARPMMQITELVTRWFTEVLLLVVLLSTCAMQFYIVRHSENDGVLKTCADVMKH